MSISPLVISDTFQTWFNTTNSIISEINGITVHNILPGDGISLTSNGNVYTIKHGSSVATPVTFTGPVSFTNTVSFSSAPSINAITVSVSPKSTGITIGNVVRITDAGLTLSRANSAENAEVLGIVVGSDASSDTIAISGSVNNTNFSRTISNLLGISGGTLSVGCAYFLSTDVPGGITTVEPNTYGYVSKPVLLGISGSAGGLLPYRGILIEGVTAGITAELDNKIIISVDYGIPNPRGAPPPSGYFNTLAKGDPVIYGSQTTDSTVWQSIIGLSTPKLAGRLNGATTVNGYNNIAVLDAAEPTLQIPGIILGVVSNILNNTGSVLTIEITTKGGSFNTLLSELDSNLYKLTTADGTSVNGGIFAYNTTEGKFAPVESTELLNTEFFATLIPLNDGFGTVKFYYNGTQRSSELVSSFAPLSFAGSSISGITGSLEYDNIIPNGSLSVWQRTFNGFNGVTFSGLSTFNTPIADRWFYIADSNTLTGITLNVTKNSFDADQIVVPGSPYYWLDISQRYSGAPSSNYRPRLENIQRGARLLQGQEATVTFWAFAGVCGATMDLVYNRYVDNTTQYATITDISDALAARESIASGIQLSSTWAQYSYSFTPTQQIVVSGSEIGWFGIGFEFPSSGVTLSIAQVKVELGTDVADYLYAQPESELNRCKPYYLRTYDLDQATGFTGTSRLNEQYLTLGNLLSQKTYDIKFSEQLVQTPTVILYSPTGQANEAFNVTKNADMRFPRCEGCPIHVNLPWDTSTVRTSLPSGNITVTNTTKNGMQLTINNGATHLDTLKFHYVADSDIQFDTI